LIVWRYCLSFVLLALCFLKVPAQKPLFKTIPPQYELEYLPLNFKEQPDLIHNITEDREGNLWLPGSRGLHVFDGQRMTTYNSGSEAFFLNAKLSNNGFPFCALDKAGYLWMTDNNNLLIKFDPAKRTVTDSFFHPPAPGAINFMLAAHPVSGLFFTTIQYEKRIITLYHRKENKAVKLFETDFNKTSGVFYYLVGNEHWIVDGNRAIRLSIDGKKARSYSYPHGACSQLLVYATDSTIYFADNEHQYIYYFNRAADKLELFLELPPLENGKVHAFYVENNKVYLGSNLYLFIIDRLSGTWQDLSTQFTNLVRQRAPQNLSEQLIRFFRQVDGSILLLTARNIFRIKSKLPPLTRFRESVDAEINSSRPVSYRAITEDGHKNIYASYYTGIVKKKLGATAFTRIPTNQYLNGDKLSTYSLNYWRGFLLWNNIKIELATGKFSYLFDSLSAGHCTQLLQHDSLWLYQWNSKLLHCYDLSRAVLTSYPLEPAMDTSTVTTGLKDVNDMISDASGENLWLASHYFGLCLVTKKGKLLKQFRHQDLSISDDYITDLERVGNRLWFGCTDGLGVLDIKTEKVKIFKNPFVQNGRLMNRSVFTIQADSIGNFYLGSSHGIVYFDTRTTTFYNLPEGHPLSTPEFNRAAVFKSGLGRYYFGSTDGLFSFTGKELAFTKVSDTLRPLKLYGISIFNSKNNRYEYSSENLDALEELVLDPFDNTIEFSFSVPEFYRNVYYSYRIRSRGEKWTDYKPDNKILLYGLAPGDYILEVKASSSIGDDHAVYYRLPLHMNQTWYKRPWFIATVFLLMAALFFSLLRYRYQIRLGRQKELAALRTKISSDLHDDVGSLLSGLAMQSQVLSYGAKEEQKQPLREISEMSREAMEHMRDTVWAIDSRKDKFENLIDRMKDFAEKTLPLKNITHEFLIENVEGKKFLGPEKRQAIYLIFKEAITNIIKHSDGKHVRIGLEENKERLRLTVQDDGSKKAPSKSGGLGWSNMKMRAEKIGGTLDTRYENGFVVELNL